MKDFKIIEIMELFDEGEITTADQIDRPQKALDREMFEDFNKRNPMAGGGMLVQPGFGGTRQGYATSKTKTNKFKYKITNQHGTFYSDTKRDTRGGEFRSRFSSKKEKLIMDQYNLTKNDFKRHGKYGVPAIIDGKPNPKYTSIVNFVKRDFKPPVQSSGNIRFGNVIKVKKSQSVTSAVQKKIMDNFELPPGEKWNFKSNKNPNGFKYGVGGREDNALVKRIERFLKQKEKYTIAADNATAKGWMMNAMNRLYKNEIKNKVKYKDLTYQPIKKDGIIIGFIDNTAAGAGKAYYGLNKNTPENATSWTAHGDFKRVNKFLDISNGIKQEPGKVLQKILDDKGITKLLDQKGVQLTLNDVLSHQRYYDVLSKTSSKALLERQIVLHHTKRVGSNLATAAATKDLQLLTGAINANVNKLENTAKKRKLNFDEIEQLKNHGAKITDFDGKVVGGGFSDPTKQFKLIEKGAIDYAKSDQFNIKTVTSYLERLGCGKAAGGRVFYNEGAIGLTKCAEKGKNKLEMIIKSGAKLDSNDAKLATQIIRAGRSLGSAFTLSGLLGPQALAFTALAEAGLVGYDMLTTGKTLREVIGDSLLNYALGEKTKIDPQEELFKRFSGLGYSDEQIGKFANILNQTNTLNTILKQDLKVGNLQDEVKAFREQPKDQFMIADDEMLQTDQAIRAEQALKDEQENLKNLLTDYRSQPPVGLNMEDTILGDMASGKFQETQQDLQAANIFADLQKEQTARDNFGRFFRGARSEQAREDRIAGLEQDYLNLLQERGPQLTPFAGGGIAKLAGIDEGPQTVSMNPDSQGLRSLKKRVKNI